MPPVRLANYNDSLLPADLDSRLLPPAARTSSPLAAWATSTTPTCPCTRYTSTTRDWSQGATFTGDNNSQLIAIATFTPACNGAYGGACVPQKGVTDKLDSLGDRLMYRFAYWEDQPLANVLATPPMPVPAQHWLVNFDVTASGGQNGAALVRDHGADQGRSANCPHASSSRARMLPTRNWRWMGSIARDKVGDILVGYSESCIQPVPVDLRRWPPGQRPLGLAIWNPRY